MCFPFTAKVPDSELTWLFGSTSPQTLETWSQLDNLLSHFSASVLPDPDFKQRIQSLLREIQRCSEEQNFASIDCQHRENLEERIKFLIEQFRLLFAPVNRYSCETLLWSFQVFASAPQVYNLIRNTHLTLPHSSYLKRLQSVFNIGSGMQQNVHVEYLRQKCQRMKDFERTVILMIDEIYVSGQLSYKQGKFEGGANNDISSSANTAQVFMISSVLSKHKDVVCIVPVKNMTAMILSDMIKEVLQILHNVGFITICVISDNNVINRKAFSHLCGGNLQTSIPHPLSPTDRLFFLFDSVHIFKCVRNNWLAQLDHEKTFLLPPCGSDHKAEHYKASFSHLRKLQSQEHSMTVKLAPALNQKSLYPTATERQNVNLMLKVFDDRNVLALEHYEKVWNIDTEGTRSFLTIFIKLWNILNVKHPSKGIRLRNPDCSPISDVNDVNVQFLRSVIHWLKSWNDRKLKPRQGSLSTETMTALLHSLECFVHLIEYLTKERNLKYLLLGKFQTDNLEFRFGQYRHMSGSNFHVSVQQVLEGERKLKLMSVLKLVSASKGNLALKDVTGPLEEVKQQSEAVTDDEFNQFTHVLPESEHVQLENEVVKGLVFVAGYCAFKILPKFPCEACKRELSTGDKLQLEGTDETKTYLAAIDRGGLTWPSDLLVQICTGSYTIFQSIINNVQLEHAFLRCNNQRKLLLQLLNQHFKDIGLCETSCKTCGRDQFTIITKCCKPVVNIFLNNYSKKFNDKTSTGNKARKINTFRKN